MDFKVRGLEFKSSECKKKKMGGARSRDRDRGSIGLGIGIGIGGSIGLGIGIGLGVVRETLPSPQKSGKITYSEENYQVKNKIT